MESKSYKSADASTAGPLPRSKSKRVRPSNKKSIETATGRRRQKKCKPEPEGALTRGTEGNSAAAAEADVARIVRPYVESAAEITERKEREWREGIESYLTFHPDKEWRCFHYPTGYYGRSLKMVDYAESIAKTLPEMLDQGIAGLPKEIGGIVVEYFRFTIADVLKWTIQSCRKLLGENIRLNAIIFPQCENDSAAPLQREAYFRRQAHWTLYWCLVRSFLPGCIPMKSGGPFIPEYDLSSEGIPYKDVGNYPRIFPTPPGSTNRCFESGTTIPTFLTLVGRDEHALLSHPSVRDGAPGLFSEVLCELTQDLDIIGPCLNTSKVTSKMVYQLLDVSVLSYSPIDQQRARTSRQEELLFQIVALAELRVIIENDFPSARRAWNTFQKLYQFGDPLPILESEQTAAASTLFSCLASI